MRLQKLEVYGFKSFADKTSFEFENGLTAFVGPNGCGKSNVVDAVRWALGEQRPKALRGSEMADVIFKGNGQGRRSLGVAEVTITVSNEHRTLPIEYDQVAITRRLYRSGESEYLLNGNPCRLRDIRELLMDTGIGMDAYSIVEQGKIDVILQSNPKDRRAIFEEAAGISKYNARRRAAKRKLERVEQNLLRLGDTIEEVKKRLRSIRRQAAAARRYKEYADNLSQLRLAQLLHQYDQLVRERADTEAAIVTAEDEERGLTAAIERLEAELTTLEADAFESDQQYSRLEAQHAETVAQAESIEESIRLNHERIEDADAAERRTRQELAQFDARLQANAQDRQGAAEQAKALEADLRDLDARAESSRAALQELSQKCGELGRQMDALRTEMLDAVRQRANWQNELTALQSEVRAMDAQRQRLLRRDAEIARQMAELETEQAQATARQGELERGIEAARRRFAARAEERGELRAQIEALSEQIAQENNELSAKTSRRDLLADLEARFEGVEMGTQTLLERQEGGHAVRGMVADLLHVEPEYAVAIEAALGGAVQHLVADTLDSAAEAVSHLKTVDGGRSTLLPLDRLGANGHNGNGGPQHPGVVGKALDLVRFDSEIGPAMKHLLGDTYVVRDLEAAVEIARDSENDVCLATLSGDVLRPRGTVTGGSPHERTGLLSRKNELRTVSEEIARLQQTLGQRRGQRDHFIEECGVLDEELEQSRQNLNQLNLDLATVREQLSRLGDRLRALDEERLVGRAEIDEVDLDLAQRRTRMGSVAAEMKASDAREEELKGRLERVEGERHEAEGRRGTLERELGQHAITRAHKASELDHLQRAIARLEGEVGDIESAREHAESELTEIAARRETARTEIAAKEEEIKTLVQRRDGLREKRVEIENRRGEVRQQIGDRRDQVHQTREAQRVSQEATQKLRLRLNEQNLRVEDIVGKGREEHDQDIVQLHQEYEEPDVNWDEVRHEMGELKRKIDNMGTVNLLAIEEQTELEQRADFLSSQEQDLLKAKHSLQEVIRKVNRQSRQLFEQTFNTVRTNFQELFRKLFRGGRADILLEPDMDILEAGVEIVAKPPGKEQTRLSLLSGGEKSLTAAALLLAIFKSKPSPFCILDEVDAALDDANIGRFVGMLREFVKESQFILITHSKQTMSIADALYGITMQEPGVSTKMGVRLDDVAHEPQVA